MPIHPGEKVHKCLDSSGPHSVVPVSPPPHTQCCLHTWQRPTQVTSPRSYKQTLRQLSMWLARPTQSSEPCPLELYSRGRQSTNGNPAGPRKKTCFWCCFYLVQRRLLWTWLCFLNSRALNQGRRDQRACQHWKERQVRKLWMTCAPGIPKINGSGAGAS